MPDAILGRPILEGVGIDTKELLAAAEDKMGALVDVAAMMCPENYSDGSIARVFNDLVYHENKGEQGESFEGDDDPWLYLGIGEKSEIEDAIGEAIHNVTEN